MEGSEQLSRGFKRPMVHHPEAAAAASRVKTRSQVLMEELGLSAASGGDSSGRGPADSSSSESGGRLVCEQHHVTLSILLVEPSSQWLPAAAAVGQTCHTRTRLAAVN